MIGGAKKLPTNLLLDEHIEKILFIAWMVLVYSDEERRQTLRTAVFHFFNYNGQSGTPVPTIT